MIPVEIWVQSPGELSRTTKRAFGSRGPCGEFYRGYICTLSKGQVGTHIAGITPTLYAAEWTDDPALAVPEGL